MHVTLAAVPGYRGKMVEGSGLKYVAGHVLTLTSVLAIRDS
jgi:hypothetical protein